jgi:2-amino-4-hydroxy-6-hydroxymethyldihydropteridine diphosphokinase
MNKTYLLLGSNMGDSQLQLSRAIKYISKEVGTVIRQSKLYTTAAWGNTNQPDFLNQVIIVETALTPKNSIQTILGIEEKMGRVRTIKNAPRMIDIDILYFNKEIIDSKLLIVPHPEIQNRRFALIPLNELSPNFVHPLIGKSNHQLLSDCTDELNVKKF